MYLGYLAYLILEIKKIEATPSTHGHDDPPLLSPKVQSSSGHAELILIRPTTSNSVLLNRIFTVAHLNSDTKIVYIIHRLQTDRIKKA